MIYLGCDPDTHSTGMAAVDEHGRVLGVWCIKAKGKTEGQAVVAMSRAFDAFLPKIYATDDLDWHSLDAVAVEFPEIVYSAREGKNPRNIITLTAVAGVCLGRIVASTYFKCNHYFPRPREWKGSVPKHIHQARTCKHLGWAYEVHGKDQGRYCQPSDPPKLLGDDTLNPGDWKHIMDAIGLALWAKDKSRS